MTNNTNIHGSDNKVAGRDIHINQESIIYKHIENFDKIIKSSKVDYEFLIEICDTHRFFYSVFLDADSHNYSPKKELFTEFYQFIDHSYEHQDILIEAHAPTTQDNDPIFDGLDHYDVLVSGNISKIINYLGIADDLLDEYLYSGHIKHTDLVRITLTLLELINRAVELTPIDPSFKNEFLIIKEDLNTKLDRLYYTLNKYEISRDNETELA
jgi:hypothetical protein